MAEPNKRKPSAKKTKIPVDAEPVLRWPQPLPPAGFIPMAGGTEGWANLAKSLKAEIGGELIETHRGTVSLPFALGRHERVAVKSWTTGASKACGSWR